MSSREEKINQWYGGEKNVVLIFETKFKEQLILGIGSNTLDVSYLYTTKESNYDISLEKRVEIKNVAQWETPEGIRKNVVVFDDYFELDNLVRSLLFEIINVSKQKNILIEYSMSEVNEILEKMGTMYNKSILKDKFLGRKEMIPLESFQLILQYTLLKISATLRVQIQEDKNNGNTSELRSSMYSQICSVIAHYDAMEVGAEDLYDMLVEIQEKWEDVVGSK